jgi:hypothetical protein
MSSSGYRFFERRKVRANGGITLLLSVSPSGPKGSYSHTVRIACDYGSIPYLIDALQGAIAFVQERYENDGDDDD